MWSDLAFDAWRRGREAADPVDGRRWLERACRIAPDDDMLRLSLGLACLDGADPQTARTLFRPIAERWDVLEAWMGLAAAALRLQDAVEAGHAMQAVLSRHAAKRTTGLPISCWTASPSPRDGTERRAASHRVAGC